MPWLPQVNYFPITPYVLHYIIAAIIRRSRALPLFLQAKMTAWPVRSFRKLQIPLSRNMSDFLWGQPELVLLLININKILQNKTHFLINQNQALNLSQVNHTDILWKQWLLIWLGHHLKHHLSFSETVSVWNLMRKYIDIPKNQTSI